MGSVVVVASENDSTVGVAVNQERIYWWSVLDSRIASAAKDDPTRVETVAFRPKQTVTAVVADASGVYWLENGPDEDGATSSRIMTKDGSGTRAVFRTTDALRYLALSPMRVDTSAHSAVCVAPRGDGAGGCISVSSSDNALADDGFNVFYTFADGIYALGGKQIVSGAANAHDLVLDGTNVYAVVPRPPGNALVKGDKNGPATAVTDVAKTPAGRILLALDNLGLVYANVDDGTIWRQPTTGGEPTMLKSGVTRPNAIVADANGVYWSTDDGHVVWVVR